MLVLPTMDIRRTLVMHGFRKEKRNEIAAKLQQGFSKGKILNYIRGNAGVELLHDHVIDNQDAINIQQAYGLEEV